MAKLQLTRGIEHDLAGKKKGKRFEAGKTVTLKQLEAAGFAKKAIANWRKSGVIVEKEE
jgi:hypothetical protein